MFPMTRHRIRPSLLLLVLLALLCCVCQLLWRRGHVAMLVTTLLIPCSYAVDVYLYVLRERVFRLGDVLSRWKKNCG